MLSRQLLSAAFTSLCCVVLSVVLLGGTASADTATLYPTDDGYMYESGPGGTGSNDLLKVGYSSTYEDYRSCLKFDISSIPSGSTINSATLKCHYRSYIGATTERNMRVYRITSNWSEGSITWNNNYYGYYDEVSVGGGSQRWYEWDVTLLVTYWMQGTYDNYGIMIKCYPEGGTDSNVLCFESKEDGSNTPYLLVNYTLPSSGDVYEPDNSSAQAKFMAHNTCTLQHSIDPATDQDWKYFDLIQLSEVTIQTSGPSGDTRMWLYDSSLNEIEYDDDGGDGTFSKIVRSGSGALSAGRYYIKVDEYNNDDIIPEYYFDLTVTPLSQPDPELVDADCYVSPSSTTPGARITVYFRIYNPRSSSVNVGLGCSIRKHGTSTDISDPDDDVYRSCPSGYSTQYRYFDVPSSAHGEYDVAWGIWETIGVGTPWELIWKDNELTVNRGPNAPGTPYMNHDSGNDTGQSQYDGITKNGKPVFSWSAASDPDGDSIAGYYVSYTDSTPDSDDYWVTSTSWGPGLFDPEIPDGNRTLYVRAKDSMGALGSVSSVGFTIDKTALAPPTFVSPSEGVEITDTSPLLDWNSVSGAWKYQVYVREDAFPWLDARTSPERTTSSWTVSPDLALKAWGWQVKVWDVAGNEGSYGRNGVAGDWGHFTVVAGTCTIQLTVRDTDSQGLQYATGEYHAGGSVQWSKTANASGYMSDSSSPCSGSSFCRAKTVCTRIDVQDENSGGDTVEWDTPSFSTLGGGTFSKTIDLNNSSGVNTSEGSVAFRETMRAWDYVDSNYSYQCPLTDVHVDSSSGPSCAGNVLYFPHGRAVLDNGVPSSSASIDDTMLHEYGHAVQYDVFDGWGRPAGCSCTNHGGTANDCSFDAFIEGWANYFPVMLYSHINANDSHYDWSESTGRTDIESDANTSTEERDEWSFAGVLFDIYDAVNDDPMSLGDWAVWYVLENMGSAQSTTVEGFFQFFIDWMPQHAAALEQVYLNHGMHPDWLTLSKATIDFGESSTSDSFTIQRVGWYGNTGTPWNQPDWSITTDVGWITNVSPSSGDTETETDTITVTINRDALSDGVNMGHVTVTPGHYGRAQMITVIATKTTDDAYEENDSYTEAYDFTSEQTWLSSIGGMGVQADEDWYEISVSPSGHERVQVDCRFIHADGDIDIALYDASGTLLSSSTGTSDNESIDHVVPSAGTYYIRVYYGNAGNTYDLWWDDLLANHDPEITSGDVDPNSGDTSTTFSYTVDYYDQDGDSPSTKYVYIDGSPHTMGLHSGSASDGTYQYQTTFLAGSYTYYFSFTDGHGGSDRLPASGSYSGPMVCVAPTANYTGSPRSGCAPLGVSFTDQSTGSPTSWSWDFGDGATSTEQNSSHTYASAGTYAVTLTVSNACGSDSETKTGYITVDPAPVANYTGSPRSGCAPLGVSFTDQSTGSPTSWSWDFGDGATSTEQNPSHTYASASTYAVSLTVSNDCGSDSKTEAGYITVNPAPVADFTGSPTSGCAPLTVSFTDQSTGSPTSWSWDFGDGATSTEQNPSHTYASASTYAVSLTVSNDCGSDSKTEAGYITVDPAPVANYTGSPTSGCAPLTVSFADQSTGSPTSWLWDFGDGGTSTDPSPTHTFISPGTYTVTLTVSNDCDSDSKSETVIVNSAPIADFTASTTSGCAPLTVNFTDQSTGSPTSWLWDFGDGGTSTDQSPTHTYNDPGTYPVSLTVSNGCGSDSRSETVIVNSAPVADFTASTTSGCAPLTVSFTDQSTGSPASWLWDFGDGGTSTDPSPTHTFISPGTYTVTLTVSNDCGSDSRSETVIVNSVPIADFTASTTSGCAPLTVSFADQSTGSPTSWLWDFGDGETSTDPSPTHTFISPGTYTVTLTVSNDCDSDSKSETVIVNSAPIADFTASTTSGCAPLTVNFTDQSTGSPTSWLWDFGDGETSTDPSPTHTYIIPGTHCVTLTVSNDCGSDTKTVCFTVGTAPIADFTASPRSGCAPLTVKFTDQSTGSPTSWLWDFGDGETSTDPSPTHTYINPGKYTVSLSVSNDCDSDTKTEVGYIIVDACTDMYVAPPPLGNDINNGTSPDSPFATIQHAFDVAQGSEAAPAIIHVAAGTYAENVVMDSWESLEGAWNSDFSQRWDFEDNGLEPTAEYQTIIDGGGSGSCITLDNVEGSVVIDGFTITNGSASDSGGGIYNAFSSPTISHCIFHANSANNGGGIYNASCSPTLINCTFYGNSAETGGGIYNDASSPSITNCILWGNSANSGPEVHNTSNSSPIIAYSDIEGCGVSGDHWDESLGIDGGANIDDDPLFVDPQNADYHLQLESPCVDAGDPASDFSDEPDPNGGRINMGAYGGTRQATKSCDSEIYFEGPEKLIVEEEGTFTLMTGVPDSKTLKAYNIQVDYDDTMLTFLSYTADNCPTFPPANVNDETPGIVIINGFDTTGVSGPTVFCLIEFTFRGEDVGEDVGQDVRQDVGQTKLTITVNSYGQSADNQFPPCPKDFTVNIVECIRGDADGGGSVDIFDALIVAEYDAGLRPPEELPGFACADVDCTDSVDIFDALKIAEFDAGLIPNLDCD